MFYLEGLSSKIESNNEAISDIVLMIYLVELDDEDGQLIESPVLMGISHLKLRY